MTSLSTLSIMSNIITSPGDAFPQLQQKPTILLPLLAIVIANMLLIVIYYNTVDFSWLVDHLVESSGQEQSLSEQEQMRNALEKMSPATMGVISAVSIAIIMPLIFSLSTLYLLIISAVTNDGYKFKHWFSLIVWCAVPMLFSALASLINILFNSSGQLAPEQINPLILANLLSIDASGQGKILTFIDVGLIWSLILLIIGYQHWTNKHRSLGKSAGIILAPVIVIILIALLLA